MVKMIVRMCYEERRSADGVKYRLDQFSDYYYNRYGTCSDEYVRDMWLRAGRQ